MRHNVARDMAWAQQAFAENWWRIAPLIGGGTLVPNEDAVAGKSSALDIESGVDWWIKQRGPDGIIQNIPLAARTQDADRGHYASFTVRQERLHEYSTGITELQKRRSELNTPGVIKPYYACQMYVGRKSRDFVVGGIATTVDIMAAIRVGTYSWRLNTTEPDQPVTFLAVYWADMVENGQDVKYACGEGTQLSLVRRRRSDPAMRRRKPCPSCGYHYVIHATHRNDCTAGKVTPDEALDNVLAVFGPHIVIEEPF